MLVELREGRRCRGTAFISEPAANLHRALQSYKAYLRDARARDKCSATLHFVSLSENPWPLRVANPDILPAEVIALNPT